MNNLTNNANFEKEREIKLESNSRRNNLKFYGIPEEDRIVTLLLSRRRTEVKKDDINGISIQRIH